MAIAGGWSHNLALKNDGTVAVWSSDYFTSGDSGATNVPAGLGNIVALAPGGGHHCLVLKDDGTEFGWGDNGSGSVTGVPTTGYAAGQATVAGQIVTNVVALAAGNHPSLALKNDGTIVNWGTSTTPPPAGLSNIMAIAAGVGNGMALKRDGSVTQWGNVRPPPPAASSNVVAIGTGDFNYVALLNDALPADGSPFIMQHPFNCAARIQQPALFVVGAVGTVPLNYQWQFNGTNIDGANRAQLLLTNVTWGDGGVYQCVVSNSLLTVTSSPAILTPTRSGPIFDTTSNALQFTDGGFNLRLIGLSGHGDVLVHASEDLVNWNPIFTNPPVVGELEFIDTTATNSALRFYRAEEK